VPRKLASRACPALIALCWAALAALTAGVANAEGWHSGQPSPPPATEGKGVQAPIPLGHIGDIEFWAPNRGLLITAGNDAIPAGLYYYNGVSWRELSTVCGGTDGRIAWAGPDDFWTISDQPTGQQIGSVAASPADRSLCHFQNGSVVASYAEPIGVAESYEPMDAAACSGPSDCWFGGERLPAGPNSGAFHLRWNGSTVSAVPSLLDPEPQLEDPGREVAHLAAFKGRFYESVQVQPGDQQAPSEPSEPFLLHRIVEGSSKPFEPLTISGPLVAGKREPFSYGAGTPEQLAAFAFAAGAGGLWAIAGPLEGAAHPTQTKVTAARLTSRSFEQIALADPSGVFAGNKEIGGVAVEPGSEDAWVSVDQYPRGVAPPAATALVARIHPDGTVDPAESLPEGPEVGHKGVAEAIACPAQGDCWMATSGGWLFHLGGAHAQDIDPNFQSLITYRPPDASIPFVAPETFPEDDSGANPPPLPPLPQPPPAKTGPSKVPAPLFTGVKERLVGHTTLALTFTLATRSRVRLFALRRKRRVAQTRLLTLGHGRHTLTLRLNPRAWPTKLDLRVKAVGPVPLVAAGSQEGEAPGGPTAVSTSYRAPNRSLASALLPPW
jgi:hypothetical protein